MENNPEAAAQATEATNTNTNQTEAPAEAKTEAPAGNDLGLTAEQAAEFKKFVEANGGFEKSFKTFKERISNPTPEAPKEKEPEQAPTQTQQPAQESAPVRIPEGFMSQKEDALNAHYLRLSTKEEYKPIADKLRNGEAIAEMRKFGIEPMDKDGNINIGTAYRFLDLLAKTVPAKPAETPEASQAPTVDYIPTNQGKIDSVQQAMQIVSQSAQLKSKGLAEHPDIAAAKEFLKNSWNPAKK